MDALFAVEHVPDTCAGESSVIVAKVAEVGVVCDFANGSGPTPRRGLAVDAPRRTWVAVDALL